ncbi:MAG: membrane-bound lytic murein transglycosylase MltF [Proteobacteria bacterium]|nr:membrane-bound lytic murein transglycosylase MltF [Pseudomonadota bacterium]
MTRNFFELYSSRQAISLQLFLLAWLLLLSPSSNISKWEMIQKRGYLNYGTRTSLLTYLETIESKTGLEYVILKKFCEKHELELKPIVFDSNSDLFSQLEHGSIDIAGGNLSITTNRQKDYDFTVAYGNSSIEAVVHEGFRNIKNFQGLKPAKGVITGHSSYSELFESFPNAADWNLTITHEESLYDVIEGVSSKKIDYTFADSNIISIYKKFVPGLYHVIRLTEPQDTAFMLSKTRNSDLISTLNNHITKTINSGDLEKIKQQIIDDIPTVKIADTVNFIKNYRTRWLKIKQMIYEVAQKHQIDPMLLAAISYQESHWNPDARSYTGVRGLMMLTKLVAKELNISDRTDPYESLDGGVRYFKKMLKTIPQRIPEPDKTKFALAAYNIGYRHLEGARRLTQKNQKNPDKWEDVALFLPLLNDPKLSVQLKLGYADGKTAVIYVNNIMTYKNLLHWKEQKSN